MPTILAMPMESMPQLSLIIFVIFPEIKHLDIYYLPEIKK